ncbi:MAG TPA: NDP-sugar synthase [Vicinamibacteria bacterium]|jgi:NDP-sugar pyrophosphorylase family protein
MVLAAGLGTRMRPLSLLKAKPALPVLNRPLIHWTLELLARHGVKEVMVNLHHLPSTVMRAVGDGAAFGLRVSYSRERRILGTGGGPRRVREFLGDEPFLLVNGDVVFDFDLTDLVRRHNASGARATLALCENPDVRRYGAVTTGPGGWIQAFGGHAPSRNGAGAFFAGIHVMDPALLDRLPPGPSDSVRDLYIPLIRERGRVLGVRVRGPWYDFGNPSLYLSSQVAMLRSGFRGLEVDTLIHPRARVHPDSWIRRCVIGPDTVVEAGSVLKESVVWDRVRIGASATVRCCVLATGTRVHAHERAEKLVVVPAGGRARTAARSRGRRYELGTSA